MAVNPSITDVVILRLMARGASREGAGSILKGGSSPFPSDSFALVRAAAEGGSVSGQLMAATQQMQGMNQSFNLLYLQLQQKMQSENRQYTMLSNIMKAKHDTAKNAINNIR